jgi:hypothetical protein
MYSTVVQCPVNVKRYPTMRHDTFPRIHIHILEHNQRKKEIGEYDDKKSSTYCTLLTGFIKVKNRK